MAPIAHGRARRGRRADDGQVAPLAIIVLLVAGGALLLLIPLGRATFDRAEARTAADAAALAGAAEGHAAARTLAEANGGEIVEIAESGNAITVTVRVGAAIATARAERDEPPAGSVGPGRTGLAPAMLAAIDRAEQLLGRPLTIVSGFRSREDQQRLWDNRFSNPYPVAPPGRSRHETGVAIDVPSSDVAELSRVGPMAGLCRPLPATDPIHFELCRWNPS